MYAEDSTMQGLSIFLLKASGTDVFVICLSLFIFTKIGAENISVEYGKSEKLHLLSIHEIHASLGPTRCRRLPFFHLFNGCVTKSHHS